MSGDAADRLSGARVALVTGASRGLGRAVALRLAASGVTVVATAKTEGALTETDDLSRAAGFPLTLVPLDLTEGASVDTLGPSLFARFGRLDILVHCAAVLPVLTPVAHIQDKHFAQAAAVNVEATWRLIRTCEPLLTRAPAGRAVFCSCAVAEEPQAYWGLHGATLAASAHLARCFAMETAGTALRVTVYDPGVMATRLRASAFPGEVATTLPTPEGAAGAIVALCG